MVQALREMLLHLMTVMVLSGMMELLLPDGSTRPLVRLVMGMFVVTVCLEPAAKLFGE